MPSISGNKNAEIWSFLNRRYPVPEYCLLSEVRDAAGFSGRRSADGLVMGMWASRGYNLTGLEIKISRSDWLRERKNPEKADPIFKYCDHWYLVAHEGVATKEEIPAPWGFMEVQGKKLVEVIRAPKNVPVEMDRKFFSAILRRATQGMIPSNSIEEAVESRVQTRIENEKKSANSDYDRLKKAHNELLENVKLFEEGSGLSIAHGWNNVKVAKIVKYLTNGGTHDIVHDLENFLSRNETSLRIMSEVLALCKDFEQKTPENFE